MSHAFLMQDGNIVAVVLRMCSLRCNCQSFQPSLRVSVYRLLQICDSTRGYEGQPDIDQSTGRKQAIETC